MSDSDPDEGLLADYSCRCDQCVQAIKLIRYAEDLGFELLPWQRAVMLNMAKCSRANVSSGWLQQAMNGAQRRTDQTPPWRGAVMRQTRQTSRREHLNAPRD